MDTIPKVPTGPQINENIKPEISPRIIKPFLPKKTSIETIPNKENINATIIKVMEVKNEERTTYKKYSVKDMIQKYNTVAVASKESCGKRCPVLSSQQKPLAKSTSEASCKLSDSPRNKNQVAESSTTSINYCSEELCPPLKPQRSDITSKDTQTSNVELVNEMDQSGIQEVDSQLKMFSLKKSDIDIVQHSNKIDGVNLQPLDTSYQSRTTIAKTSKGVRIIIDIFFDSDAKVAKSDVIGSRFETAIPRSRILSEFQDAHNVSPASSTSGAHGHMDTSTC